MKINEFLGCLVCVTLLASCARTVEKQDIVGSASESAPPFQIKECYFKPTNVPDEYELVRVFRFTDGREWNPGKLILKVGRPVELQIQTQTPKVPAYGMRVILLSVDATNAELESSVSLGQNTNTTVTRLSIPVRIN